MSIEQSVNFDTVYGPSAFTMNGRLFAKNISHPNKSGNSEKNSTLRVSNRFLEIAYSDDNVLRLPANCSWQIA